MVRIVTLECPVCGTILAGNVLEDRREIRCPGLGCREVLRFGDIPEADREYLSSNSELYRLDEE